jgi:hypothetical protein
MTSKSVGSTPSRVVMSTPVSRDDFGGGDVGGGDNIESLSTILNISDRLQAN